MKVHVVMQNLDQQFQLLCQHMPPSKAHLQGLEQTAFDASIAAAQLGMSNGPAQHHAPRASLSQSGDRTGHDSLSKPRLNPRRVNLFILQPL